MIPTLLWILLSVQIFMGAFDTLFHHELTERLAWRPSQKDELRLHGVRNLIYGVLFVGIGCLQMTGWLAWLVLALLVIEVGITLKDFVEEDQTRKLPASERINHTLLALNYGAILVLLVPVLIAWSKLPAGITLQTYGVWSALMVFSALGVSVFGVRDLAASRRLQRMTVPEARQLLPHGAPKKSILITGGTGFIGSRLIEALVSNGHAVTVLTRKMKSADTLATPVRIVTSLDQIDNAEVFDAIINLAGQPVAGWLWTEAYKAKVMASRTDTTRAVLGLIKRLEQTPECLINGSAIGVYGANADQPIGEESQIEPDGSFAQALCLAWESEARKAKALGVRTVLLRIGLVLDTAGGPLGQMIIPFEFGVGGPFGKGDHWMSWITRDDLVRLIFTCIQDQALAGPVNATAPQPVTNKTFAAALGKALRRPALIPVPAILLKTGLGALADEIFLASQNILPKAATRAGFEFETPDIETAFARLLSLPETPDALNNHSEAGAVSAVQPPA